MEFRSQGDLIVMWAPAVFALSLIWLLYIWVLAEALSSLFFLHLVPSRYMRCI